jgi:NADH:ubiquinone oxidoreductase subunit F (NADH-binding)/(2Fe-2S) ferredoxin
MISLCCGTGCRAGGSMEVLEAFKEEFKRKSLQNKIVIKETGCHGFCEKGPLVVIYPDKIFYNSVTKDDVPGIVSETIMKGEIIDKLLYEDPVEKVKVTKEDEVTFYNKQQRLTFGKNGLINPTDISDYMALNGYMSLGKVLTEMSSEEVIKEIKESGLRGRGGAGFTTGIKWELCRKINGQPKYIVCNADEGDPGAFMDRSLLEGNPHSILEGMIIGGFAIGAQKGFIYVRKEYPLAVKHLEIAIEQAREKGFLGENILGSGFCFDLEIFKGAGAFVCGEETGLLASLQGRTGEPRPRPPYPAERGLWGKPTNINNVKTWANVPMIIYKGAEWYSKIGTKSSKGTMIFSLVGKINNTGLIEVPMGITLRQIIQEIGGGIPNGKRFKAVQTGGPSGGCIPESKLDIAVDYEELTKVGSMMGSGGMIVMDEDTCMVDVAKYFTNFLRDESCGKCFTCRKGIQRMYEILDDISNGKGTMGQLDLLEELAFVIKDTTMCGLGQTAPNPVLSTIRYFREEYMAHLEEKRCPAGVCKELITYSINEDCTGCLACLKPCPSGAISGQKKEMHVVDIEKCIKCGVCKSVCKYDAVEVV